MTPDEYLAALPAEIQQTLGALVRAVGCLSSEEKVLAIAAFAGAADVIAERLPDDEAASLVVLLAAAGNVVLSIQLPADDYRKAVA